jgi:hypothetical protein
MEFSEIKAAVEALENRFELLDNLEFCSYENRQTISRVTKRKINMLGYEFNSFERKLRENFQAVCCHDWRGSVKDHIDKKCIICDKIIMDGSR